jgi:SAM-dependent methyltransferase
MTIEKQINTEIARIKKLVASDMPKDSEDFNVRGELYRLALELAPHAREQDINYMREWLQLIPGEVGLDIAAGTGFLTRHLAQWSKSPVYAIDPSAVQLNALKLRCPSEQVVAIHGSLSEATTLKHFDGVISQLDYVTSYGGLHHVLDIDGINRQHRLFKHVGLLLKQGGRFIAGDVGANTTLARHFTESVKKNCLTGHEEKWLSAERLRSELTEDTGLAFVRSEIVPIVWEFKSLHEMAMFMRALHAYDMTDAEIIRDLSAVLGFVLAPDGRIKLSWPMMLFELRKK